MKRIHATHHPCSIEIINRTKDGTAVQNVSCCQFDLQCFHRFQQVKNISKRMMGAPVCDTAKKTKSGVGRRCSPQSSPMLDDLQYCSIRGRFFHDSFHEGEQGYPAGQSRVEVGEIEEGRRGERRRSPRGAWRAYGSRAGLRLLDITSLSAHKSCPFLYRLQLLTALPFPSLHLATVVEMFGSHASERWPELDNFKVQPAQWRL